MEYDGDGGGYPHVSAHCEAGGDDHAIYKVVDGIAENVEVSESFRGGPLVLTLLDIRVVAVAMVPVDEPLQDEEHHETHGYVDEDHFLVDQLDCLREQVENGSPQDGPRRECDEEEQDAVESILLQ